jgi:(R,R)-butanediol dehydrogenase / meso-butanediol dehydrogenase / diacetyl reductase
MKAARLHARRDLRIDDIEAPGAITATQLRVRPLWCGICGTDLHEYLHGPLYIEPSTMPQVMGHEFSASVAEVGSSVRDFAVGDRVVVLPHIYCGTCHYCLRGRQGLCRSLRLTAFTDPSGGLAEEAVVEARQCVVIPDGVTSDQAAVLEPLATVVHGVERVLRPGNSVLITGAGPIGQLSVLACIAYGAGSVFVSEPNAVRRVQAERLGATRVFDPAATDVVAELLELTGGLGPECALECAGSQPALDACIAATRPAGTIGQVALHVGERTVVPETWTLKDLTIAGIWSFKIYDTPKILDQIAAGKLPVERVISSRIALADLVSAGIDRLADPNGDQVKILVSASG